MIPAGARRQLRDAMAHWSREGFHVQHHLAAVSEVCILLYEQGGRAAWDYFGGLASSYKQSYTFRIPAARIEYTRTHAYAVLAAAADAPTEALLARRRA